MAEKVFKEFDLQAVKDYCREHGWLANMWHRDDVRDAVNQGAEEGEEKEIADEVCDEVLDDVERYHDAEHGINWDVIRYHSQQHVE